MTLHTAKGFRLAGTHCGLKRDDKKDIALLVSDQPCTPVGVFTTNRVKAAPVQYDQEMLAPDDAQVRAVLANTGSANACTGAQGLENARQTASQVAARIGCQPNEVLTLSTGVIGTHLPMDVMAQGIDALAEMIQPDGWADAAEAIMTTDTRPKLASFQHPSGFTITGMAKGAGMIAPNMATMLAVIVTDAEMPRWLLSRALNEAVGVSFNRIVVDGDMSTNDSVLLLANGAAGVSTTMREFVPALTKVCTELAQAIVRDGEGATRFVSVHVTGAVNEEVATQVARQVATSALVKTAFYGADPNWGRILAAAGYAGVELDPGRLALWLLDANGDIALQLVECSRPLDYDEAAAIALMQTPEWGIRLDLGQGAAYSLVWTCDFSHEYVTINGHYRT